MARPQGKAFPYQRVAISIRDRFGRHGQLRLENLPIPKEDEEVFLSNGEDV
jgi:hypothetical protein